MDIDWTHALAEQLDWHWRTSLRPRLDGLTDEEYHCFGMRAASHFGGPSVSYETYDYPGDAATGLARLDTSYSLWMDGVRGLSPEDLLQPVGPAEGPWAESPMADLVLHINREAMHHGAEMALLRDLYLWEEK